MMQLLSRIATLPHQDYVLSLLQTSFSVSCEYVGSVIIMEIGEAIKNPAYRIFQTEYSGCLDISAHA